MHQMSHERTIFQGVNSTHFTTILCAVTGHLHDLPVLTIHPSLRKLMTGGPLIDHIRKVSCLPQPGSEMALWMTHRAIECGGRSGEHSAKH